MLTLFKRRPFGGRLLLGASVFLAWLPSIRSYQPLADDYAEIVWYREGVYFKTLGVWRILGHVTPYLTTTINPYFHSLLAITLHVTTTILLYEVFKKQAAEHSALSLALVFGVFPWGFEAVLWCSTLHVVASLLLFALNLLILTRNGKSTFLLSFFITLALYLTNDYLIFATMVSGLALCLSARRWKYTALAPLLSGCLYLILYKCFSQHLVAAYRPSTLKLSSLLSVYFYQWTNVWVFEPLLNRNTNALLFFGWNALTVFSILTVASLLILGVYLYAPTDDRPKPVLTPACIVLLLLAASGVYALTGAFTLDTRKKYPLVALCLMLLAWIWQRYFPRLVFGKAVLSCLIALGALTTWTIIGIWRYEEQRGHSLVEFLAEKHLSEIKLESNPDLYREWPALAQSVGFRFDEYWVINLGLWARGSQPVRLSDTAPVLLRYDKQKWEVVGH
jgi:hypothetical protein